MSKSVKTDTPIAEKARQLGPAPSRATLPGRLARALGCQLSLFQALPGRGAPTFVTINFTQPGDGFEPLDYGRGALIDSLIATAPAAAAVALAGLPQHGD